MSARRRLALITLLDPARLRRLEREGPFQEIGYVRSPLGHEEIQSRTKIKLVRFDFKDMPRAYLTHLRAVYERVERLFARADIASGEAAAAEALGLAPERVSRSLRKAAALALDEDVKLSVLGEALFEGYEKTCYLRHPELAPSGVPGPAARAADPRGELGERLRTGARAAYLLARIARPCAAPPPPAARPALLFDQAYSSLKNQEFVSFYRYLRARPDVAYNCLGGAGDEVAALLKKDGKPAGSHRWGVAGLGRKARAAGRAAAAARLPLPEVLRGWSLRLLQAKLAAESLLEAVRPEVYLRVRSDLEPAHPIVTAVAERLGVRHAGYMSGSYPFFDYHYAWLDFHDYGLLGPAFADIFREAWPRSMRVRALGPFAAEVDEPRACAANERPVLGAFSTTTDDGFYIQEHVHRRFVEAVCRAARALGARVIFKEKHVSSTTRALIRSSAGGFKDYEAVSFLTDGVRVQDVLERSDLVAVMGTTTAGWEALGRLRKVVFYEQAWAPHPLDGAEPALVAKSEAEFDARVAELMRMPQADYERRVRPTVERFCKVSDGNLVRDFMEGILTGRS